MSSLSSLETAASGPSTGLLEEALVLVAEQSFFSYAAACHAAQFEELLEALSAAQADGRCRWLHASVAFRGQISGAVEIAVPEPLGRHLFESFAGGRDSNEPLAEGQQVDAVGELTNMVAGRWLMLACQGRPCQLVPPVVAWQDGPPPVPTDAGTQVVCAAIEDMPLVACVITR